MPIRAHLHVVRLSKLLAAVSAELECFLAACTTTAPQHCMRRLLAEGAVAHTHARTGSSLAQRAVAEVCRDLHSGARQRSSHILRLRRRPRQLRLHFAEGRVEHAQSQPPPCLLQSGQRGQQLSRQVEERCHRGGCEGGEVRCCVRAGGLLRQLYSATSHFQQLKNRSD
eukprot:COSAG03_NODE_5199_length_1317_cov_1.490148_2_plen_169_part_00